MEFYKAMASIIENATDASQDQPNKQAFTEVAELIKSRSDMPKEAVRNFMARFQKKTRQIVLLTIELIEFCTYACEMNFHTALNNKDFLLKVSALLSSQSTDSEVKDRVLQLLSVFSKEFKKDIHVTYFQFQDRVKSKGFNIPMDYQSRYRGATVSCANPAKYSSSKPSSGGASQSAQRVSSSMDPGPVAPKYEMAKKDLMQLKDQITRANHLIDTHDYKQRVGSDSELARLMSRLGKMDTELQQLVAQVIDCEAMALFALPLNDDLNATIERFNLLKNGVQPPSMGVGSGEEVEPEILKQIEEMELREKQQKQSQQQHSQFGNNSTFDDFNQPAVKQTQQQNTAPPKPQATENLLDFFDDAPTTNQSNNNNNQNQSNNQQGGGDLFDIMDAPAPQQQQQQQNNQQMQNNNSQTPAQNMNIQNLYGNPQGQPKQDKYSILDNMNSGGMGMNNNMGMGMNNNMGMNYNNMGGMGMNNSTTGGMGMNNSTTGGMGMNNNNMGRGMGMNNNMGGMGMNNNMGGTGMNNNMGGMGMNNNMGGMGMSTNMNNQGMGMNNNMGGMGMQQSSYQPKPISNTQFQPLNMNNTQEKKPFDGLDDMFGLGGGSSQQSQPQQQQQPQYQKPQQAQSSAFDDLL